MSWLRTRSAYRIIVDHSGKEYFHHIQHHATKQIINADEDFIIEACLVDSDIKSSVVWFLVTCSSRCQKVS
jgi:hypothetical protein